MNWDWDGCCCDDEGYGSAGSGSGDGGHIGGFSFCFEGLVLVVGWLVVKTDSDVDLGC